MSAHDSSHGASKKDKAKVEAQRARARQAIQKPAITTPSIPLFDGPKKATALDHTSQKIQQVLGNYNEVKPYEYPGNMLGVSRQPTTPLVTDHKPSFHWDQSSSHRHVNGQHKPTENTTARKAEQNRSYNQPHSKDGAGSSNSRKSLPHFPPHSSHDSSKTRSPVKVPPFSHSSPIKQTQSNSRLSVSPVPVQKSKMTLKSYRSSVSTSKPRPHSSHNPSAITQNSISSPNHNMTVSSQNFKTTSHGMKEPLTPPNGTLSDQGKAGNKNNQLKLVIPEASKNPDILDEIFNEMTIQPPLTGIQTPRKAEDKFPFPAQKISGSNLSTNTSSTESFNNVNDEKIKHPVGRKNVPDANTEIKTKTDLAENRKTAAMKPNKIKRDRTVSSSSESSSGSSSESGSDSDSNNSDEAEDDAGKEKSEEEKEEVKNDLDKSVDSTSSTESQPSVAKWNLMSFVEKPKTSPLSQMSASSEQGAGSKIDDENNALIDEMVKSIPGKKLEDIGHSATLPFDIPSLSDDNDDVTLPDCDMERCQNGAHSDDDKNHRNHCSPSTLSSCSSNSNSREVGKSVKKHKSNKHRQSSSNKSTSEKIKKDGKSSKKSNSSDTKLKPPDSKKKDEKRHKSLLSKRKKMISRDWVDSDSDIDVDVVSVTPETKILATMSSNLTADHNQNDKCPVPKQLFTSPKHGGSPESKLNNSQSSSSSNKSSKHRDRDVEHKKTLYKQNHINNVKKIKPQNYNSSDEDESTDCGQEVEDMLESTEDFRPPSLHSPLPPCPYPCKDIKSSPSDTKILVSHDYSINLLKSSKASQSPSKLECAEKIQNVKNSSIVVKIDLSFIKKVQKASQCALKIVKTADIKAGVKLEKENLVTDQTSPGSKPCEITSTSKDHTGKKLKKVSGSLDDSVSKKDVSNGTKSSPTKITKSSFSIKSETDSTSSSKKSVNSKTSDTSNNSNSKDSSDIKKESEFTTTNNNNKRESGDSNKDSTRTKDSKPHKRKSETNLSSDSAKKHKTSLTKSISSVTSSSTTSSSSSSNSKKSSSLSVSTENGIDGDTEDEKCLSSRTERRNSSSSTSSRHSNKSQSKKPRLESTSSKESTGDKSSKKEYTVQQNGDNHLPFSNYAENHITPASPSKPRKSQSHKLSASDESDQADHYLSRAIELKHKADSQKDKPVQLITYAEAVLAFIQCGIAMERKKISEPVKIFSMYTDTHQLLKWICCRFRQDQSSQDKKLSVLILRIQSLLCLKLYYLKKPEALKFKKILETHDQNKVSKVSHAPSPHQGWNNRSTGIPSPLSPTPSPAGSIGSVGSQGSCDISASKVTNGSSLPSATVPMASPGSVSVTQRIHSVTQQYISISSFLVNAMEYWDMADQSSMEFTSFFSQLNKAVGVLVFTHTGFPKLISYVQKGLQCLKDT